MSEPNPPDAETTDPNPLLAGRYRIVRELAQGGMGVVYLAEQVELRRTVALKVLQPPRGDDQGIDFEERFRVEARTLARLSHPHIVTLHDFGRLADGRYFLAMEYVDGPRVADLFRAGPMPADKAVPLLLQVADALRYAHRRGVVHRDLKPSNLLVEVRDDGAHHVKVVDFGLVKLQDEDQTATGVGLVLGSPHCMAPEQIRGETTDPRTDLYALGILFFRALTGRYPFHGSSATATMMAHLEQAAPRFASVAPDVVTPFGLEAVVQRCLSKSPEDRFADAQAVIDALTEVQEAQGDLFRTATVALSSFRGRIRAGDRRDRNLGLAVLLAVVFGLAGAATGAYALFRAPADRVAAPTEAAAQVAPVPPPREAPLPAPEATPSQVGADDATAEPAPEAAEPAPKPAEPAPEAAEPAPEAAEPAPVRRPPPARPAPRPSPEPVRARPTPPPAETTPSPTEPAGDDAVEAPKGYKALPEF